MFVLWYAAAIGSTMAFVVIATIRNGGQELDFGSELVLVTYGGAILAAVAMFAFIHFIPSVNALADAEHAHQYDAGTIDRTLDPPTDNPYRSPNQH